MTDRPNFDSDTIRKLLGGYATGTLTPEEQQALFEAALTDQEVFDALAVEQPLHDLLRDPAARAQLLASIEDVPVPWYKRFWIPGTLVAATAALVAVGIFVTREKPLPPAPLLVAHVDPAPPLPSTPPLVVEKALPRPAPKTKPLGTVLDGAPVQDALNAKKDVATPLPQPAPAPPPPPVALPAAAPVRAAEPAAALERANAEATLGKPIPPQNEPNLRDQKAAAAAPAGPPAAQSQSMGQVQNQTQAKDLPAQFNSLQLGQALAVKRLAVNLDVKWAVLRQRDGGDFAEVDPGQLRAGDVVKVQLIPDDDGFVSLSDGDTPLLTAVPVERLKKLESPIIIGSPAGQRILKVQFARTAPVEAKSARKVADKQSAPYVVPTSTTRPVSVTITLNFR
ncbi:MAG TPA: hypothetical protein VG456_23765 [Candidatus Sulfopaludibacter sp.]|jgi:hypothetical protein|nr:hypothetical protein [Candidatus Sulfopaludibacter sp.]